MIHCLIPITLVAAQLATIPIDTIMPKQFSPIAPRGGVMMLQLFSDTPSSDWPSEIEITFQDGTSTQAVLGWIEINSQPSSWTQHPFKIRPISKEDDLSVVDPLDSVTGPVLLAEIPRNCKGVIRFGNVTLSPNYFDVPDAFPNLNIDDVPFGIPLQYKESDQLPEPNALSYWRWALLASTKNQIMLEPEFQTLVEQLTARHSEQVWRIGFHRLAASSRGVAAACRDLLTGVSSEQNHSFACWVVSAKSIQTLMFLMLDRSIDLDQRRIEGLNWVKSVPPYIYWIEQLFCDQVVIKVANPFHMETIVPFKWDHEEYPTVVKIPPKEVAEIVVHRAPQLDLSVFGPVTSESQFQWLKIQFGGYTTDLPIPPPELVATPPRVQLAPLHPRYSLWSIRGGNSPRVIEQLQTHVELRKVFGKWELFIQCHGLGNNATLPNVVNEVLTVIGTEAISILVPFQQAPLVLSPSGKSVNKPSECVIHTTVQNDGWKARIVLPNQWVDENEFSFAVARTHGDSQEIETGPLPCVPWDLTPKPIVIDLSKWDDVLQFPIQMNPTTL